ncbi:MAG: glycine--tRNA ligase subunit beta [Erythrobacter sp.]|jgi:glycyl-tRNA synthetase beta chain|nr:glycine--tRNA ligase subunit beta [Erythrobacter sp.]
MADFLLELRCEEIPARMQGAARAELEKLFRRELYAAGVSAGDVTIWSTPRRLALIARGLPLATEAVSEEAKGPPEGAPDAAIDGFCKKAGVSRDQLELRDVKGRMTYFAVVNIPGRPMAEVLAAAIPAIIRDFSWPKSMRWGAASISTDSLRWVRPLSGIVALLNGEVIDVEVGGIASGRETMGHRFHSSGAISIASADDYAAKLRAAHVIVDHEERQNLIRERAAKVAADAGLTLVADEGLVVENAGLTEWPVPLLGRFDETFLDVPPEVIQLTARVNQKYFVCEGTEGKLANAFVCTANIDPVDPAVVIDGNRKVLAARLSDARFFWEQDQKTPLAVHAEKLARITFHEKLGTVADKVERVAKLARWLCEEGIVAGDPALAEQAARLCKADLVTEMVGEFPELQGLMGGYYAAREGLPVEVSDAIRDHYKPVGQGDDVPTAPVTVAVSLADKLDTLRSFFKIDEKPTGSKDPFALRRAALGTIRLITDNGLRMGVAEGDLLDFFADRLKVQQREAGVRHDLIDAVFALGQETGNVEDDLVRLLARVHALQAFVTTEDGTNLLAGYKRAANILKKEGFEGGAGEAGLSYTPEPAEKALIDALDTAAPLAAQAVEAERFADAMAALATLRVPIDRFFEEVTVNAQEADKRQARLALLARFRDAVHRVADFSRIEG